MTRVDFNQNHPAPAREEQCDCDDAQLVSTADIHLMSQSFTPLSHSCSSSFVVYRTLLRRFAVACVKRGMGGVTRISVDVQVWSVDADAIAAPGLILWCSRQSSLAEEVFWSHSFLDKATPGWHTAVMVGWYSTAQYSTVHSRQAMGTFRSL